MHCDPSPQQLSQRHSCLDRCILGAVAAVSEDKSTAQLHPFISREEQSSGRDRERKTNLR